MATSEVALAATGSTAPRALRLDGIEHERRSPTVVPVADAVPTRAPRSWSTVQVGCASSSTAASPATCAAGGRRARHGAVAAAGERARDGDAGRDEIGLERAAVAETRGGEAGDRAIVRVRGRDRLTEGHGCIATRVDGLGEQQAGEAGKHRDRDRDAIVEPEGAVRDRAVAVQQHGLRTRGSGRDDPRADGAAIARISTAFPVTLLMPSVVW